MFHCWLFMLSGSTYSLFWQFPITLSRSPLVNNALGKPLTTSGVPTDSGRTETEGHESQGTWGTKLGSCLGFGNMGPWLFHGKILAWWNRLQNWGTLKDSCQFHIGQSQKSWPFSSCLAWWNITLSMHGTGKYKATWLVEFYGKCRDIYHTWILWVINRL